MQEHIEGYHELTAKTKSFFSTAVAKWDADFYVKIDDDVHVNLGTFHLKFLFYHSVKIKSTFIKMDSLIILSPIGMLATTLAYHRSKPRVYIGCMKSGPVLSSK